MSFEEFFKKKKIDLDAFEKGNPALLFEFKSHFEQMGEKSFDHTKKYWFNKLRLQYHLAPEVKAEKIRMENPLAEQTVTDSLAESTLPEPRPAATSKVQSARITERPATEHTETNTGEVKAGPGFTPRFKAAAEKKTEESATDKPKGFTPRFKARVTKPAEDAIPTEETKAEEPVKPKVGFTPRFKAGITKPTDGATAPLAEESKPEEEPPVESKPKVGFTPRFKAGVTKPAEGTSAKAEEPTPVEPVAEKPKGFTPRFKAGITKTASAPEAEPSAAGKKTEELPAAAEDKPKIGFTPRFKAGITKQKPPAEE